VNKACQSSLSFFASAALFCTVARQNQCLSEPKVASFCVVVAGAMLYAGATGHAARAKSAAVAAAAATNAAAGGSHGGAAGRDDDDAALGASERDIELTSLLPHSRPAEKRNGAKCAPPSV